MPANRWIEKYIDSVYKLPDDSAVDADIAITEKDIEYEVAQAKKNGNESSAFRFFVPLALYRKICAYALEHDAFLMHGALIEYEGRGYLFTATSGTGKTTHIRLWQELFGEDKVTIVNGDKPIIRFIDGKVYAYGTPWNGKEHYGTSGRVELHAICFVERDENNSIRRIPSEAGVPRLFSQIMISDSTDLAKQLELADRLVENVPMYLLKCNITTDAARVAYEGMRASEENK